MQDVTLTLLRDSVRRMCDMDNTELISDTFLTESINANLAEIHDVLVNSFADYFVETHPYVIAADASNELLLPLDFYKMIRVAALSSDGLLSELRHGSPRELLIDSVQFVTDNAYLRYMLRGGRLVFFKRPVAGSLTIEYVPMFTKLIADSDTVPWLIPVGWENYVVYKSCADCLAKEESDPMYWLQRAAEAKMAIIENATSRDVPYDLTWTDVEERDSENALFGGFYYYD